MHFAIGDVVRDRSNLALGTVTGVATDSGGCLVAFQVSGGGIRLAKPYDLDLLARSSVAMTTRRRAAALFVLVFAVFAAVLGCTSAWKLGANWLLTLLTGLGSYTATTNTYRWWLRLTGPRRFRL